MRVTVVDPPAYTPPYDHSLCRALAERGMDVELVTSHFRYGPVPEPRGYRRSESFYRHGAGNRIAKSLAHPVGMSRLAARTKQLPLGVTHFQWLPVPQLDQLLVRRVPRPRVLTAHDLLPREAGDHRRRAARAAMDKMDAIVVHSQSGRDRLTRDFGLAADRVHVIPHGAFDYLTELDSDGRLDPAVGDLTGKKVVLFFGLIRPYKGVDVLIEAFAKAPADAVLIVAGNPRMPIEPLRRLAGELGLADRVRFVDRFIPDAEIPAYFERADLVVLPYRETEQSGVLFSALAFGSAVIASDVGGFSEVGATGAAELVPPNDTAALGQKIEQLLASEERRAQLAEAARQAAAGPYSWGRAAELTESLYRSLLPDGAAS